MNREALESPKEGYFKSNALLIDKMIHSNQSTRNGTPEYLLLMDGWLAGWLLLYSTHEPSTSSFNVITVHVITLVCRPTRTTAVLFDNN